jgi:hypothetical protein
MKEIEHALARVYVDGAPLTRHQLHVAQALAAWTKNAELGVQLAVASLEKTTRRSRSSVKSALSSLAAAGVIIRRPPPTGERYATDLFFFARTIQRAAEKSRPFLGPPIHFSTQIAKNCTAEIPQAVENKRKNDASGGQNQMGSNFGQYIQRDTPPQVFSRGGDASAPVPSSPAPLRGAGGRDFDSEQVKLFFDFLQKNKIIEIETFCQRRKKDGLRGGTFHPRVFKTSDFRHFESHAKWAQKEGFELTMRARGQLLLVDDLSKSAIKSIAKMNVAGALIETSTSNFQYLILAERLENDQIRAAQRQLAAQLGGDAAATSAGQLHRLPGSLNRKNGGRFLAKLVKMFDGRKFEASDILTISDIEKEISRRQKGGPEGAGASEREMSLACSLARRGHAQLEIETAIMASAAARNRHGDHRAYALRTAQKAIKFIAERPARVS